MPSELSDRIRTGVTLAACITLIVLAPAMIVGLVVIVFTVIGSGEFTAMLSRKDIILPEWMLPGTAVLMGLGALGGSNGLHAMLLVSGMAWVVYELLFNEKSGSHEVNRLGIGLLGMLLVSWSLSHITLIKSEEEGTSLLFLLIFVISFSDIFAYFGGKQYGNTPLAPSVSPKKTWEGSFIGAAAASIFAALFAELILDYFWFVGLILGLLTAAGGQLGDLLESRIKRICGVKDSGSLLPGHGGILDRVDGYMIAAPLFYYLIQIG